MQKKVFQIIVDNTAGVLSRISGLFSRRGYNIESITAGVTADPRFTRITIVASGDEDILDQIEKQVEKNEGNGGDAFADDEDADDMLTAAIDIVVESGQASTSMLQRRLKLGYSRAARIIDQMEQRGVIGPSEGSKPRKVLITRQQWIEMNMNESQE